MIRYDDGPATFNPPSLEFEHHYIGALLIFDDEVWHEITIKQCIRTEEVRSTTGRVYELFREYKHDNQNILLVYPNTGASAAVIDFELLIASGIENFVTFGTCGVFDPEISRNSIIIPTAAVREEGTSYHYLPPEDNISFDESIVKRMRECAEASDLPYRTGKIWTTDAVYRETAQKIKMMIDQGCVGVDMELSALMAVAKFRKVNFAEFLIADDLVPPKLTRMTKPAERSTAKLIDLASAILGAELNLAAQTDA